MEDFFIAGIGWNAQPNTGVGGDDAGVYTCKCGTDDGECLTDCFMPDFCTTSGKPRVHVRFCDEAGGVIGAATKPCEELVVVGASVIVGGE